MSETSQSVGRIAILTAFTLLFAAAWRSDCSAPRSIAAPIACSKRGSGSAGIAESPGSIAAGMQAVSPLVEKTLHDAYLPGRLLSLATRSSDAPKPLFSSSAALLERSSVVQDGSESRTAAADALVQTVE
ncbi:MAG: hypothetical protein JNG89_09020 [Planctomycetaceae bacterium]|nr:hypothetical protein [Planctomycetaceae bacterium]